LLCGLSLSAQTRLVLNVGNATTTLAGNGKNATTKNGDALNSSLGSPRAVTYDPQGNLFLVDSRNNQVTRLTPDGQLTIVAGTGQEGYAGDSGPATSALLDRPSAIALQPDGTLLIADTGNHRIRSIDPEGIIHTIAGTGSAGNGGDGGPATSAQLRSPAGIALDADGTVLIADTGNHRIRRINASSTMTAVAGNGKEGDAGDGGPATAATFLRPTASLLLPDKRILIADTGAHRLRVLMPNGQIAAFDTTTLRRPQGMAMDPAGSLLIADADLQQLLQVANGGYVVLAGNRGQGSAANGSLNSPSSAAVDNNGGIAIADTGNHQVQHVALPTMDFGNIPAGKQSAAQVLLLQNDAGDSLQITSVALTSAFTLVPGGTCDAFPITLAAHSTCSLQIAFLPNVQGPAKVVGLVQTTTGPPAALLLTGTGIADTNLATSSTALTSNGAISYAGAPVQFTATITGSLLTAPTGNLTLQEGNTNLATVALTSGKATVATTALTSGQHTLRAIYSGDASYASSTSAAITQTVIAAPDFSLSTPAASYSGNASGTVTIPISVLPLNGTLNHTASIAISGLPTGVTATFLPSTFNLAGDPVAITLIIKVPATLASSPTNQSQWIAAALLLAVLPLKRKRAPAMLLVMLLLSLQGCGGFRTTSISTGSSTTHSYTCALTVTTTGVLADTLTHSIPLELDLTQ
jgi:sugar lactone lactonase YvrE